MDDGVSEEPSSGLALVERLLKLFSPPLDSALVTAIGSDYPPTPAGESEARGVLESLAAEASVAEKEADESRQAEVEAAFEAWSLQEEALDRDLATDSASASAPSTATADRVSSEVGSSDPDVDVDHLPNGKASDPTLAFLQSLFPTRSEQALRDALKALPVASANTEPPGSNVDVSTLVEQFLTEDFLDSPQSLDPLESTALSSPALGSKSSSNGTETPSKHRRRKKRDQAAQRGLQTISLTDVMHSDLKKRYAAAAAADSASEDEAPRELTPGVSAFLRGKEIDNKWVTLDSQANYVGRLLDISAGTVTSAYHRADSNLVLALDRLIRQLVSERSAAEASGAGEAQAHESTVAELTVAPPIGPTRSRAELLQLSLLTRGDADAARELIAFLDGLARKHGSVTWNGLVHGGSLEESTGPFNRRAKLGPVNGGIGSLSAPDVELEAEPLHSTASEYLAQAAQCRAKRDTAFRTAASSFQSSRSRGGLQGAARRGETAYWAEEGRNWDAKVKALEMKAARANVEERKRAKGIAVGSGSGTIDLHGLTLNQSLTVTKEQLNIWWTSGQTDLLDSG